MLLTAHHADDQLETVLLRLFRGAGVRGLCGILPVGELGPGSFGRPLLEIPKAEIVAVARAWQLSWIEDPSNIEQHFDRNFLRGSVVPRIRERWPSADRTVGRTARHMRDAEALLQTVAVADAAGLDDPHRIPLGKLRQLEPARRRNVVRAALTEADLPSPTTEQLRALFAMVDAARPDAEAFVHWPGAEAHLYRDHLHLIAELPPRTADPSDERVTPAEPWSGPEGEIALVDAEPAGATAVLADEVVRDGLEVRFRSGGERFKPAFDPHHRKLKTLFQEAGIVPWMRQRIPLLYRAGSLVAVGDLWVSDVARVRSEGERAWRVRWTGHPALE
jgi:tRNA(Ile)-lysidine synthase